MYKYKKIPQNRQEKRAVERELKDRIPRLEKTINHMIALIFTAPEEYSYNHLYTKMLEYYIDLTEFFNKNTEFLEFDTYHFCNLFNPLEDENLDK